VHDVPSYVAPAYYKDDHEYLDGLGQWPNSGGAHTLELLYDPEGAAIRFGPIHVFYCGWQDPLGRDVPCTCGWGLDADAGVTGEIDGEIATSNPVCV
jgi:hypothetical protein